VTRTKADLKELHEFHLAESENMRKHVQTRQYHVAMAEMYYKLFRDAPGDRF